MARHPGRPAPGIYRGARNPRVCLFGARSRRRPVGAAARARTAGHLGLAAGAAARGARGRAGHPAPVPGPVPGGAGGRAAPARPAAGAGGPILDRDLRPAGQAPVELLARGGEALAGGPPRRDRVPLGRRRHPARGGPGAVAARQPARSSARIPAAVAGGGGQRGGRRPSRDPRRARSPLDREAGRRDRGGLDALDPGGADPLVDAAARRRDTVPSSGCAVPLAGGGGRAPERGAAPGRGAGRIPRDDLR